MCNTKKIRVSIIILIKSKFYNNIKVISVCIVTYINILHKHFVWKCKICVPPKENVYIRISMRMASEPKYVPVVCKIIVFMEFVGVHRKASQGKSSQLIHVTLFRSRWHSVYDNTSNCLDFSPNHSNRYKFPPLSLYSSNFSAFVFYVALRSSKLNSLSDMEYAVY